MKSRKSRQEEKVQKCSAEIRAHLPHLENAHTPLVVIAGLAEYLGDTLYLAQKLNACSHAQARVISGHVRQIAATDARQTDAGDLQDYDVTDAVHPDQDRRGRGSHLP
jgi:hypothetical protein